MTDYVIQAGINGWSSKDDLTSGAALKVVRGTEFQEEFNAIRDAIQSKYDDDTIAVDIDGGTIDNTAIGATTASTGNFSTLSIAGTAITSTAAELNILDGKAFLDEDDMASDSATGIPSQQSVKAYVDSQSTGVSGISSSATTTAMTLTASNDIGIGETTPTARLHVKDSAGGGVPVIIEDTGESENYIRFISSGTTNGPLVGGLGNNFIVGVESQEKVRITSSKSTLKNQINMPDLPTSSTGLSAGDLWNDGGTLKIVT